MATLSGFIRECLTEDKYGTTYVSEIEERIKTLNLTQLNMMCKVLEQSKADAKMKLWKEGNEEILRHVYTWKNIRQEQHDALVAQEEEVKRVIREKKQKKAIKQREKENVIEQLKHTARVNAEKEVKAKMAERLAANKLKLLQEIPIAEERSYKYYKAAAAFFILAVVICAASIPVALYAGLSVVLIFFITLGIVYRGYKVGIVEPLREDPEAMRREIDELEQQYIDEALENLENIEIAWQQKQEEEREERKLLREQRRLRLQLEAEAMPDGDGAKIVEDATLSFDYDDRQAEPKNSDDLQLVDVEPATNIVSDVQQECIITLLNVTLSDFAKSIESKKLKMFLKFDARDIMLSTDVHHYNGDKTVTWKYQDEIVAKMKFLLCPHEDLEVSLYDAANKKVVLGKCVIPGRDIIGADRDSNSCAYMDRIDIIKNEVVTVCRLAFVASVNTFDEIV